MEAPSSFLCRLGRLPFNFAGAGAAHTLEITVLVFSVPSRSAGRLPFNLDGAGAHSGAIHFDPLPRPPLSTFD